MKIIKMVTGTGSSGTTFFIRLMEELGLTVCSNLYYNSDINGGFEYTLYDKIDNQNLYNQIPPVIKDPRFMFGELQEIVRKLQSKHNLDVDHIFICFREFDQSVKSRISRGLSFHGWKDLQGVGENLYDKHIDFYRKCLQKTIEDCMKLNIELTFIDYNKMHNPFYLYKKLKKVYMSLDLETVEKAHSSCYVPKFKNNY